MLLTQLLRRFSLVSSTRGARLLPQLSRMASEFYVSAGIREDDNKSASPSRRESQALRGPPGQQ